MTPLEEAAKLYEKHPQGRELEEDIAWYVQNGYVWSSPDSLILAELCDDCWFVYLFVGELSELFRVCPKRTKWVEFARRGKRPVRYLFDEMRRRCEKRLILNI